MPRSKIHATLDTLHQQLREQTALDESDPAHLREVLHVIEDALRADQVGEQIGDRVKQSVAAFETNHPTIATALHGIIDSLAKL